MKFDAQAATMKREEIVALLAAHQELTDSLDHLRNRNEALLRQVEWFKRQLFGSRSERRVLDPERRQLWLGEAQADHGQAVQPGLTVAERTVISEKVTYRLAQRPEFRSHLPLYRQHQRMEAAGVHLARSTLTGLMLRCGDLLEPIYHAQLRSILAGAVVTMDETPIKAGRTERRSMQTAYFWPVFGDRNEVAFPFSPSRSAAVVREVLGEYGGVLLSDGYRAYESYAAKIERLVHAQCWSHTRRGFVQSEDIEPELAGKSLDLIARLYEQEAALKRKYLPDEKMLEARAERSKPLVDAFFAWLKRTLAERVLLPSNPFTEAANYALAREAGLRVFLEYPNVPIDTNHLEREIRPIAIVRSFCTPWSTDWKQSVLGSRHRATWADAARQCSQHAVAA